MPRGYYEYYWVDESDFVLPCLAALELDGGRERVEERPFPEFSIQHCLSAFVRADFRIGFINPWPMVSIDRRRICVRCSSRTFFRHYEFFTFH